MAITIEADLVKTMGREEPRALMSINASIVALQRSLPVNSIVLTPEMHYQVAGAGQYPDKEKIVGHWRYL